MLVQRFALGRTPAEREGNEVRVFLIWTLSDAP
jgi:hypothetical protein